LRLSEKTRRHQDDENRNEDRIEDRGQDAHALVYR
jgi:hypothetical protein